MDECRLELAPPRLSDGELFRQFANRMADVLDELAASRSELAAIREMLAVADAKLSRLSQLADKWDDRGGSAKGVFAKDLRNVLAGTVCGGPRPMPAPPEPEAAPTR